MTKRGGAKMGIANGLRSCNLPDTTPSRGTSLRMITADRLRELVDYDPESGQFTWRNRTGRANAGSIAGCLNTSDGYRRIRLDGKLYASARLAWLYVYGEWPREMIDHVNRVRTDDRIENLREATQGQNEVNKRAKGVSGHHGVWPHRNGWMAIVGTHPHKRTYLGFFLDKDAAIAVAAAKRRELYGEFAEA